MRGGQVSLAMSPFRRGGRSALNARRQRRRATRELDSPREFIVLERTLPGGVDHLLRL